MEIRDKKGSENVVANHLFWILLEASHPSLVSDSFTDDQLFEITQKEPSWYADIFNYLAIDKFLLTDPNKKNINFSSKSGLTFGKILSSSNAGLIRSSVPMFLRVNFIASSASPHFGLWRKL